jgi:hypothetical protein
LECGGKRSATPLFERTRVLISSGDFRPLESGVAAAALPPHSKTLARDLMIPVMRAVGAYRWTGYLSMVMMWA